MEEIYLASTLIKTKGDLAVSISIYSLAHAVVDASCAALLAVCFTNSNIDFGYMGVLVVVYNIIAFSLQVPFGFLIDVLKKPAAGAASGLIITALSMLFLKNPYIAVVLAGLGNAMFHVCGGVTILNLKPGKASIPGIYVAPGALGLFYGNYAAGRSSFKALPFVIALVLFSIIIRFIKQPVINYKNESKIKYDKFELIAILLLISVAVRSFAGLEIKFPLRLNYSFQIILLLSIFSGKALGGILADKFGWMRVTVTGLIIAAPLITFLNYKFLPAIIGMFLFNMTMPVTLTALSNMLPGRSGFAFGLTTLALVTGAFPTFTGLKAPLQNNWVLLITIIISVITLFIGLYMYFKNINQSREINKNINI
jgi:FSR family fosmidomycin resistance protein-like MFS transporter